MRKDSVKGNVKKLTVIFHEKKVSNAISSVDRPLLNGRATVSGITQRVLPPWDGIIVHAWQLVLNTLFDLRGRPIRRASRQRLGEGSAKSGRGWGNLKKKKKFAICETCEYIFWHAAKRSCVNSVKGNVKKLTAAEAKARVKAATASFIIDNVCNWSNHNGFLRV